MFYKKRLLYKIDILQVLMENSVDFCKINKIKQNETFVNEV